MTEKNETIMPTTIERRGGRKLDVTSAACAAALVLMVAGAAPAAAQDLNHVAQAVLDELNSTFLQLVAVIAIIGVSLMWMFHVIRPLTALIVGAGIAVAASATTIAGSLFTQ